MIQMDAPPQLHFSIVAIVCLFAVASAHSAAELPSLQFTYSGSFGPANWGSLDPNFTACSYGKMQSPININKNHTYENRHLGALVRNYVTADATLVDNGFNVMVRFDSDCGSLVINGVNYGLKQMHWHSPSEHQIDGVQYAAELHLVHESDAGPPTVVSILFKYGHADPFVAKLQRNFDKLAKEVSAGNSTVEIHLGVVDTKLLRKNTRKYYRYVGSLTTPPCTENVIWNILGKVRSISEEQVAALKAPLRIACKKNARPLQSLNGRKIELYSQLST